MRKRILAKGYFKGNLGDDLFLKILTDRYPNEVFEILVDPVVASYYTDIKNINIVKRNLVFKVLNKLASIFSKGGIYALLLRRYKAVVEIGGSIFPEKDRAGIVTNERIYLSEHMKHYFVIGSNFGPYETQSFVNSYQNFFGSIDGIVFRDLASKALFNSLNNVRYAPDVVLGLKDEGKDIDKKPYVAVSVIDLMYSDISRDSSLKKYAQDYENAIQSALLQLIDSGFNVKFIPFSKMQNDTEVSYKIQNRLLRLRPNANIEVFEDSNTQKILQIIKNSSYLLSTRYHAMILGWVYGIKQQVLSYSGKMDNVMQDIFPNQYCYSVRSGKQYAFEIDKMNTVKNTEELNMQAQEQFYYLDSYLREDSVEDIHG
ncbi:hypothetical protein A4W78_06845 [Latilactobacillus curvatus]|nr:hypothetical protein A4W78_06845 [Latilactobacillus curvatus]